MENVQRVVVEDHRVRVAREKRERMEAQLLDAVLRICTREEQRPPANVDDVIQEAQVSRGTFYKYFGSVEEAIGVLTSRLGNEMAESIRDIILVLPTGTEQVATGVQLWLYRTLLDPAWGAFMGSYGMIREGDLVERRIQAGIALGVEKGDFDVPFVKVGSDVLIGARYEAMRRIVRGEGKVNYIHAVVSLILRSLGVSAYKADQAVEEMFERLLREVPGRVAWWRNLPPEG